MSYNCTLLFYRVSACLRENPRKTLRELSRELRVSDRTIEKAVSLATGATFKQFREGVFLGQVRQLFSARPDVTIKEVSLGLGFNSSSSFARAVRRVSGLAPEQLRSCVGCQHAGA
jgi:AraC-like DNA-binding protein